MEKRKLKPIRERMPENKVGNNWLCDMIAKETGFRVNDIRIVLKTLVKITIDEVCKGRAVNITNLGVIYPLVKMGKNLHINLGNKPIRPFIVPKMNFSRIAKNELKKIRVTEDKINAQYVD